MAGGFTYSRAAYFWKGNHAQLVCDAAWLKEQRRFFQNLFNHQLFDEAYGFLSGAQAACEPPPDRSTWLWIESDLALAAYRMGTYATCLEHVEKAQRSPGFARVGETLHKALATNLALCAKARSKPASRYDYSWLRDRARLNDDRSGQRATGVLEAGGNHAPRDHGEE